MLGELFGAATFRPAPEQSDQGGADRHTDQCHREDARQVQNALFTVPPSTRSAAPVVADDSGLAT